MSPPSAPHVRVPTSLQFDEALARGARDLWTLLDELARDHAGVHARGPFIAAGLGCSRASLKRWREELVDTSWLHYEAGLGRGALSLWVPLHRVRRVTHRDAIRVEMSRSTQRRTATPLDPESGSRVSHSDQGKGLTAEPLSADLSLLPRAPRTQARAGEEPTTRRGPWCGACDERTRLREREDDGRPFLCPLCHPDSVPAL